MRIRAGRPGAVPKRAFSHTPSWSWPTSQGAVSARISAMVPVRPMAYARGVGEAPPFPEGGRTAVGTIHQLKVNLRDIPAARLATHPRSLGRQGALEENPTPRSAVDKVLKTELRVQWE
jgi:hypothetical protein